MVKNLPGRRRSFESFVITILVLFIPVFVNGCLPPRNNQKEVISHLQTQQAEGLSPYKATRAFFLGTSIPAAIAAEATPPSQSTIAVMVSRATVTPQPPPDIDPETTYVYYTRSGDSLPALIGRFGVPSEEIISQIDLPSQGFLEPGVQLLVGRPNYPVGPAEIMYPDSEIVYSASASGFDVGDFATEAGGYLSTYGEYIQGDIWLSGVQIVERIAEGYSLNPRLLLLLLEYQNNWVYGTPSRNGIAYPLGHIDSERRGLYQQLIWGAQHLSIGYFGWREGSLTDVYTINGEKININPTLNAGTATLQFLFSQLYVRGEWEDILYGPESIQLLSELMFGDPWQYAQKVGALIPAGLTQPEMTLPFLPGRSWNYSGGPHGTWSTYAPMGAIDFAPSGVSGCKWSEDWVTATAPGVVVKADEGVVILDLDGDGLEETGWNILFLHIATQDRVARGEKLEVGDLIGHPSCERGFSSGTHVHLARKYNGEWLAADGQVPFILSGWQVEAGEKPYQGTLRRDEQVIYSSSVGSGESRISY
jgi:LasA protease